MGHRPACITLWALPRNENRSVTRAGYLLISLRSRARALFVAVAVVFTGLFGGTVAVFVRLVLFNKPELDGCALVAVFFS